MVIDGDSHVCKWVEEGRTLEIGGPLIETHFKQYIPEGGTVIDVGACIGDHTLVYCKLVGPSGKVIAFEPQEEALQCLRFNLRDYKNCQIYGNALGSENTWIGMTTVGVNFGATHLDPTKPHTVEVRTLDEYQIHRCDFMKIDAEGSEPDILDGATETIKRCRPVMYVEVNELMLGRCGHDVQCLLRKIDRLGYDTDPKTDGSVRLGNQYDVLCLPRKQR